MYDKQYSELKLYYRLKLVGDLLSVLKKVVISLQYLASESATLFVREDNGIFRVNLNFQIFIALAVAHDLVKQFSCFGLSNVKKSRRRTKFKRIRMLH